MLRSAAAGKARDRKIEAAPEEMYGTGLPDETRAEFSEHPVYRRKNSPEPVSVFRLICGVHAVLVEWDRVWDLHRHPPDLYLDLAAGQKLHEFPIELRYRTGDKRQSPDRVIAG